MNKIIAGFLWGMWVSFSLVATWFHSGEVIFGVFLIFLPLLAFTYIFD